MGALDVRPITNVEDRNRMYGQAINDLLALEYMFQNNLISKKPAKIGAEQELCIVDRHMRPSLEALPFLKAIDDEHYTNELALYNLEINLDPLDLNGSCFRTMEKQLIELLGKADHTNKKFNSNFLLSGILPTLQYQDLTFSNMTPEPRYQTISQELADMRGENFRIHLQGTDELIMSLDSVLFEACNTSFQLHLQIHPDEFVQRHNWSQYISGPVLSLCSNSPLLFGNELWAETRIGIFKQSLDTRSAYKHLRRKLPRVYFGDQWLEKSPVELWKNDLMRFPLLLAKETKEDALTQLENGRIPKLESIRLHNGTTYTWNRLCYGHHETNPHIRIECRYLPAGPTVVDEMANMALWIGLMNKMPEGDFWKDIDFKIAKSNFYNSAVNGLKTFFTWDNKTISATELMGKHLLPMAIEGLNSVNVDSESSDYYLDIIDKRLSSGQTGSDWQINNFRSLNKRMSKPLALQYMTEVMLEYQKENLPVHSWPSIKNVYSQIRAERVEDVMSTDIIAVPEDRLVTHAKYLMMWKNIHHLPIEDEQGDLIGLITDGQIERTINTKKDTTEVLVKDIMIHDPISIESEAPLKNAVQLMNQHNISGLPVTHNKKLVGIVTNRDFER